MDGLENPYHHYESLDPHDLIDMAVVKRETAPVFSASGIRQIIEFKKQLIAEDAARDIIEGINLKDFFEGDQQFTYDYDLTRIEPYIAFGTNKDKYQFLTSCVARGFNLIVPGLLSANTNADCDSEMKYWGMGDKKDADIAIVTMWVEAI